MQKKRNKSIPFLMVFVMTFVLAAGIITNERNEAVYAALRSNSQYSLAGAQYQLYKEDGSVAKDAEGNNALLTTDAKGNTTALEIEPGTYSAKEVKASPGYKLDTAKHTIVVTENNTSSKPATFQSVEPPVYGTPNFKVYKYDKSGNNGWKTLIGTEFTIKYYDVATKGEISDAKLMKTWTFAARQIKGSDAKTTYAGFDWLTDTPISGDDFYVVSGKRVIPLGWFTIQETRAPAGMAINDKLYYGQITQPSNGADAKTKIEGADSSGNIEVPVDIPDNPQSVTLKINKQAAQDGAKEKLSGKATLEGAEYEVYYDDPILGKPELVGKITTDKNGKGEISKRELGRKAYIGDALEPGDYYIKEVKASPGFLVDRYVLGSDGESTEEFIGKKEVVVGYDSNGKAVTDTIKGSYEDGQHIFKARAITINTPVFTYTVKSNEYATETRIKKTDAATKEELPGATLQLYSLKDNSLIEEWESTKEEHIIYGLASGKYLLREITAPYGYDIAEDIEFEVAKDKIVNKVEMADKPLEIGTTAQDVDSGTHQGSFKDNETINDKVALNGLYPGRTYKVKGTLYDKATGQSLKDEEGNEITAECEAFKADAEKMEVEVRFSVDASKFDTKMTTVAFEKLYRIEPIEAKEGTPKRPDEELPVDIAKHEEIDDEDQTIRYGGIAATKAVDTKSKSHNILGKKNAVITDTVKYENLSTLDIYTVTGELYDKTTGKLTGIKATTSFKPESSNGTTTVQFKFDASKFKGHKLVAYETLLVNSIEISKHENPDDEDQTVNVPEIETIAVNPETNDHIANTSETVTIKDTVKYSNLVPNKSYTIKGTLQYRDGRSTKLKAVMKNGKPLRAKTTFTPKTENGSEVVTFVFDGIDLSGKTVVVFEDLYYGKHIVATHSDINDEDQSVHMPKIATKVGRKSGDYVIDTVEYKNLVPNRAYTVKGYFVEKANGNKVDDSDGETVFTPDKSDGKVKVKLKPVKEGETLVAFESIYLINSDDSDEVKEVLVAEHKDLNDKAQTLATRDSPDTGDFNLILLYASTSITATVLCVVLVLRRRRAGS